MPLLEQCDFVEEYCSNSSESIIPYYRIPYCMSPNNKWISYIILLVFLFFQLFLLGAVSDRFFVPSMSTISEKLRLPPSVAGVTLLGWGNGAPDILTTFANLRHGHVAQALGQLVGAGMFVSIAIVAVIILVSGGISQIHRRPFLRDVGFFILTVSSIFFITIDKVIYFWEALILVLVYVAYVTVVGVGRCIYVKLEDKDNAEKLQNEKDRLMALGLELPGTHALFKMEFADDSQKKKALLFLLRSVSGKAELLVDDQEILQHDSSSGSEPEGDEVELSLVEREDMLASILDKLTVRFLTRTGFSINAAPSDSAESGEGGVGYRQLENVTSSSGDDNEEEIFNASTSGEEYLLETIERSRDTLEGEIIDVDKMYDHYLENQQQQPSKFTKMLEYFDWTDFRWYSIFTIISMPLVLVLHLIIPWVEDKKYNRYLYICHPTAISIFILLSFQLWTEKVVINGTSLGYYVFWLLPLGIGLSVAIYFTTEEKKKPPYQFLFVLGSMLCSILMINTLAGEIVENLGVLGMAWNISPALMGLTVLGWGNSIGDFMSNVIVARKGHPQLALFACFSAPFTNLLVGLGTGFFYLAIKNGPVHLVTQGSSPDLNNVHFLGFLFILGGLVMLLIGVPLARFRIPWWFGVVLMVHYAVFLTISLLLSFKIIPLGFSLWDRGQSE